MAIEAAHEPQDALPFPCSLCQRRFKLRKSVSRHMRTVHSTKRLRCSHCGHSFVRQDILDRHVRTQHQEPTGTVECKYCGKQVRPRSLPNHRASEACRNIQEGTSAVTYQSLCSRGLSPVSSSSASINQGIAQTDRLRRRGGLNVRQGFTIGCPPRGSPNVAPATTNHSQIATVHSTEAFASPACIPFSIPVITDPVLLSSWMFIRLEPWGSGVDWMNPHNDPNEAPMPEPSHEVLELRGKVYRSIIDNLDATCRAPESTVADAIAILIFVTCQTDGWNKALVHVQGYVALARRQLNSADDLHRWLQHETSLEAFDTALMRERSLVPIIPTCKNIYLQALRVIRRAAVDMLRAPHERAQEPVEERVKHLKGRDCIERYTSEIEPIAQLASSVHVK